MASRRRRGASQRVEEARKRYTEGAPVALGADEKSDIALTGARVSSRRRRCSESARETRRVGGGGRGDEHG